MKIKFMLIISVLLLVITSTCAYAQFTPLGFAPLSDSKDAKSIKDPLFIEMQEDVHYLLPTNVKVYINDPIIKENADFVEITSGNSRPYQTSSGKISITGGGAFRQTMAYNGENVIEFGFRPDDMIGYQNSVSIQFYMTKEAPINEYPDTHDENSEFYGYQCHHETNKLVCNKKDGCTVCNYILGVVRKEFMVSDTNEAISIPSRVDFTDEKEGKDWSPGSQSLDYRDTKKVISKSGNEFETKDIYSIELKIQDSGESFELERENHLTGWTGERNKVANPDVNLNDISASGPELSGKAFEVVYNQPFKESDAADFVDISYELYAQMSPVGSGTMIIKARRQTAFEKGSGGQELDDVKSDIKNLLGSYKLSKGRVIPPERELRFRYQVRSEEKQEETLEDHYVVGSVSDYYDHPLPYVQLQALVKGKSFNAYSDKDGNFKIPLKGIEMKEGEEANLRLVVVLNYERDGKNYFNVFRRRNANRYDIVQAAVEKKLIGGEHLQIDFRLNGEGDFITNFPNKEDIKHYSVIYYHTHEAVEFVLETLKETLDYKLPVTVYVGNPDKKTLYSPSESQILISSDDASLSDSDRPDNREYHEFMHALMYDVYTAWPQGRSQPGNINHDGFLNSNTADSYMEGFAEFMAMVISDEMKEPNPAIYAGFGSMDKNYKPWDSMGFDEEFAVASLLWDMYDDINEKGDSLTMSIDDIWKVLKVKRADFYEYYNAFKQEFPEKSNEIDELFKLHGFFHDTRIGDGNYTAGEPWKYTNERTRTYRFIDMSGNVSLITYQEGFTIGKAADYNRSNRTSAVRIPNAFLKVKDDEVDFYNIKVSSSEETYDYIVDKKDGLIYIQPLPLGSDAVITVTPKSNDYTTTKPFTVTAKELNEALSPENNLDGYFAEHEFDLKATGTKTDEKYVLYENTKPTYDYEGDLGEDYEVIAEETSSFKEGKSGSSSWLSILLIFVILVLAGLFIYYYIKKPEFKNKTDKKISKILEWIKTTGWPKLKAFLIMIWKGIVKISKLIFHHSKKAYQKTKPHIRKAHENIKKKINKQKSKKNNSKTDK